VLFLAREGGLKQTRPIGRGVGGGENIWKKKKKNGGRAKWKQKKGGGERKTVNVGGGTLTEEGGKRVVMGGPTEGGALCVAVKGATNKMEYVLLACKFGTWGNEMVPLLPFEPLRRSAEGERTNGNTH